jgi:hypothetical protein
MTTHDHPREPGGETSGEIGGETSGESGDEPVWAFDDLDATWWDDVWPFRDDREDEPDPERPLSLAPPPAESGTEGLGGTGGGPLPLRVPRLPPAAALPLTTAAGRASGELPWWMRRGVLVSALAAAAFVVAGLDVLGAGHASDDPALLLKSPTYASPVTLQPGTSYIRSRVLPSGDLVVTHWIRTRSPVDSLQLVALRTLGLPEGSVTASHLVLAADGTTYPATARISDRSGTQTLTFPDARTVYLRYRLSGVLQTTGPGRRALARLTSLDVSAGGTAVQTTQVIDGATVLALACTSGPPASTPVPCGSQDSTSWSVRLAADHRPTRVMAQVDLS